MRKSLLCPLLSIFLFVSHPAFFASAASPFPPEAEAWARAQVAKMSLNDLVQYTFGHENPPHEPSIIPAYPQFGTPRMQHLDGPQGPCCTTKVTAFPSSNSIAMTWDLNLAFSFSQAVGKEEFLKGTTIVLGPAVNIARVPWGGRLFEYVGEEPFLSAAMGMRMVQGIQSNNISACIKHYVANSQEYDRFTMSSNIDKRTLHELYYPAFKAAVDAGVGSIMCSYNRLNGTYSCENNATLAYDLKTRFGFKGWVRSDGGATLSTLYANGGLDQEMPAVQYFGPALQKAVEAGQVPLARVQDMVTRILTSLYALNMLQHPSPGSMDADATSLAHTALTFKLAEQSAVLLKNSAQLLPLSLQAAGGGTISTIAVFGDNNTVTGDGSGHVNPPYIITPVEGIKNYLVAKGIKTVKVIYGGSSAASAPSIAASADIVIAVVATDSSEGSDRKNLSLGNGYDTLVSAVAKVNPHTIVVVRAPGAVEMPWLDLVPAVLFVGLAGQEAGNAMASVLFGDVNPGGKLTLSFPKTINDTWLSSYPGGPINPQQYPGTDRGRGFIEADYTEGLLVGYRFFDHWNIEPLFPFGHGLSYTSFLYTDLQVIGSVSATTTATITVVITNTGGVSGSEVPQLYLVFPPEAQEPPQLLRGFDKVFLTPQDSALVTFSLAAEDVSVFDIILDDWRIVPGSFGVRVGSSSRDVRLVGSVSVA